jgi:hypothetical protein
MKLNPNIQKDGQILVYDDVLPHYFCQKLIEKFETNAGNVQVDTVLKNVRHFKEVNISQYWADEHQIMVNAVNTAWRSYMTVANVMFDVQWPRQFGFEQFRMKRYHPNGTDEFALHTDVGSYGSARRFLAFLWYLNTVEVGGETGFGKDVNNPDLIVPAVAGRVLIFPPLWLFPHWGAKPQSGTKYIVSGYLHYV